MITTGQNMAQGLLPQTVAPTSDPRTAAHLYTRARFSSPERMGGEVVHYNSFDDFLTTFDTEASEPGVVGAADVLDIINPLQHLPLISQIYREITHDNIKPGARIMGGAVFGGGIGLASSSVNAVVEEETGKDVPTNLITALAGEDSFVRQDRGLALKGSDGPETQLNILLGNDDERMASRSPQHAASAYKRMAQNTAAENQGYERVAMVDPERMAGSFARYA